MMSFDTLITLVLTFFFIANPIGNAPAIIALVKDFDFEQQKRILIREGFFALLIALFFQYFGEFFLGALNIKDYALTLSGGILILILALDMIFNIGEPVVTDKRVKQEPYFVPIATPILSGPGLMAIIMLKSKQESNNILVTSAILMTWIGVMLVMLIAPYLQQLIGKKGLVALEQLMGMILTLISMQMIVRGAAMFLEVMKS
jgi:multiple antibiotic resistance protein